MKNKENQDSSLLARIMLDTNGRDEQAGSIEKETRFSTEVALTACNHSGMERRLTCANRARVTLLAIVLKVGIPRSRPEYMRS